MIRKRETEEDEDIWSAIQCPDPDLAHKRSNSVVALIALTLVLVIGAVLIILDLPGL